MVKDLRNIERINFLEKNNINDAQIVPLKTDASSRKYFRIFLKNSQTLVLADDELKRNKLPEFADLAAFLKEKGVKVPEVYATDFQKGFLLLEDLHRRQSYLKHVRQPRRAMKKDIGANDR